MTGSKQGGPGAQLGKLRIHRGRAERSAHAADRSRESAGCEGRASSSQTRQVVIARDGRSGGACEDGANTRDEARRGRCCRQRLAVPGNGEANRRAHSCKVAACRACLSRMFPRTSLTPGFRIGTQRKDFVCAQCHLEGLDGIARVISPRSGTSGTSGTQRCFPAEFAQTAFSREGATVFLEEIESRAPI
jgi:hypothetical protein